MNNDLLKKILVDGSYITSADFKAAEKESIVSHRPLVEHLVADGLLTRDILGQATAEYYKLSYFDLAAYPPTKELVQKLPEDFSRSYRVVAIKETKEWLTLATDTPDEKKLVPELKKIITKTKVELVYSLPEDIDTILLSYKRELDTRFAKIIKESKRIAPDIIEQIIDDALSLKASDIHFEPTGQEVVIRFRIDGVLSEAGRIQKTYYENILNRIKVDARLRIDEHLRAQDGSIRYIYNQTEPVDIRVSLAPTIEGEKVVLRLLAHYIQGLALSDLGLSPVHQKLLETAADKPFGMIIVTGPTGAGKSTTLYAVLKKLNTPDINITTIEDPVEYRIPGINQIQVNELTNLTFEQGLRSIVRQDPDIILVGEIRDHETAEISVNAALTGHLLLSSFHANDAASALPRLLDMGIAPFLLASTVELIMAERLARRICPSCRYSTSIAPAALEKEIPGIKKYIPTKSKKITIYKGKGCSVCGNTGYLGRIGIFECIPMSEEMHALANQSPTSAEIAALAKKEGNTTLFEDGMAKALQGETTIDEVVRVIGLPR